MPKRKITIEEALKTLHEAGVRVKIDSVEEPEKVSLTSAFRESEKAVDSVVEKGKFTTVVLFAKHSVGSGGEETIDKNGNKLTINNGVETYGPGKCKVPSSIAAHLLHQDALAKQADERLLDRTPKCYIVSEVRTPDGRLVNKINQVDESFFPDSLGNDGFAYLIR